MLTKRVSGERVTLATPSLNHLIRAQQSSGAIRPRLCKNSIAVRF